MVYVDLVNKLGGSVRNIQKNRNLYASKEIGLEVITGKTKSHGHV